MFRFILSRNTRPIAAPLPRLMSTKAIMTATNSTSGINQEINDFHRAKQEHSDLNPFELNKFLSEQFSSSNEKYFANRLMALPSNHRYYFMTKLRKSGLLESYLRGSYIGDVMAVLPEEDRLNFLELIGASLVDKLRLVEYLHKDEHKQLIAELGMDRVAQLNGKDLKIIKHFSPENGKAFLDALGKERILAIWCKYSESIGHLVNEDQYMQVINQLNRDEVNQLTSNGKNLSIIKYFSQENANTFLDVLGKENLLAMWNEDFQVFKDNINFERYTLLLNYLGEEGINELVTDENKIEQILKCTNGSYYINARQTFLNLLGPEKVLNFAKEYSEDLNKLADLLIGMDPYIKQKFFSSLVKEVKDKVSEFVKLLNLYHSAKVSLKVDNDTFRWKAYTAMNSMVHFHLKKKKDESTPTIKQEEVEKSGSNMQTSSRRLK